MLAKKVLIMEHVMEDHLFYITKSEKKELLKCLDFIEKTISPIFSMELKFLSKLIYKNNNQHKKSKYFQRIKQVYKRLNLYKIDELVSGLRRILVSNQKSKINHESKGVFLLQQLSYKLYALYILVNETKELIKSSYLHFASLLQQTYFMAFAVVIVSISSRFFVLSESFDNEIIKLYKLIQDIISNNERKLPSNFDEIQIYESLLGPLPDFLLKKKMIN